MKSTLAGVTRLLSRYFLAGVFAVLPLVITVGVISWVAGFLGGIVGPETTIGKVLARLGVQIAGESFAAYAVGCVVVLGVIFLLGVIAEMGAKKFIQGRIDFVANRVPLLNSIYGTAKQLVDMLDKGDDTDLKGMSVVYCGFGQESGAIFLALMPTPEAFCINGRNYNVVIIPTAPVPVGGGLIFVPTESILPADVSVDALMSIYVSMGVTGPQFLPAGKVADLPGDSA